jgi:hypothetical protein
MRECSSTEIKLTAPTLARSICAANSLFRNILPLKSLESRFCEGSSISIVRNYLKTDILLAGYREIFHSISLPLKPLRQSALDLLDAATVQV